GLRGVVRSGAWPQRGLEQDSQQVTWHDRVVFEESGPVRAVLAIKGRLAPGDKDKRFYEYTARLYFAAGSPSVRIVFTLRNGRLDPKLIDGKRRAYIWPVEDASLVADLALSGNVTAATLAEGERLDAALGEKELLIHQDSSGGEKWRKLGGGNYERWLSRYTQGKTVAGVTFRGYKALLGGKLLASGNAHRGVLDVSDGSAGVTAALRNFRVEYPSALSASAKRLRVGLFPGESAGPFALRPGPRKSCDVRLTLHAGAQADLNARHAQQDRLLLFRPSPEWMVRCANTGAWPTGMALRPKPASRGGRRWDKSKLDGIGAGWDWYGWISGWNSGGGHWNQSTCFTPWVLWGDGTNFDQAESRALWAGDLCSIHYDRPHLPTFWLMLMDWNWRENRLTLEAFDGYVNRDTWGRPDSGHMGMFMWLEYYLLTGDARAREAVEHLGIRARAMCWKHNYDDRNDGTGPLPRAINWCRKRDPDAEADFRLATRYVGWPLYDLVQYHRLTGDPKLLAEARTVARAFRNTARYSPIGFMVTQINARGDGSVYGRQGPFEKGRAESASQCYAHFQQGIMATGLVEYYLMSRDVEALDALTGFADCVCHHAMLRDASGKRRGWTYTFGDYWGPYRWEDVPGRRKASWFASNFRVVQPLGWIYRFTGRADYLAVLKDAVASARGQGVLVPAAQAAVAHPKPDATGPAAITDLRARAVGGGKVRLT
ncbi:MAG: exo-rhamnogalacturonan lyase family protein, partial [Planctomycetota bacterium]